MILNVNKKKLDSKESIENYLKTQSPKDTARKVIDCINGINNMPDDNEILQKVLIKENVNQFHRNIQKDSVIYNKKPFLSGLLEKVIEGVIEGVIVTIILYFMFGNQNTISPEEPNPYKNLEMKKEIQKKDILI